MTARHTATDREIALALSGGGTRAMVFHAGVIRYLADDGLLQQVKHISSVSGGSLLVGLILNSSGWEWPSAAKYKTAVLPYIKETLTENDLALHALLRLMRPENWRYMLSRANIIADAIEHLWSIDARLADLPDEPIWSINATTSESGRRFRFKQNAVGDYELGYANAAEFKVAHAMAVSAAYPGVIGPFLIEARRYEWRKRENWGLPKEAEQTIAPLFANLHLYDGGIYDNLGTEPLFDSGKQCVKEGTDFIMVSDAGAPLRQIGPAWFRPFRLKRVADIISEQTRALRVRSFVNFLQNHPGGGAYLQIGTNAEEKLRTYRRQNATAAELLQRDRWVSARDVARAAEYRTTLRRMEKADFDLIEQHGYETAKWNLRLFSSDESRGGAAMANGAEGQTRGSAVSVVT
jgi:NTE family protein